MGTSPAGEDGGIVTQAPDRTTRSSVPRGSSRPPPRPRGSGFAPAVPVLGHTHCVCAGTAVVFRKATHARRLPHGRGSGVLLVFPPSCLLDPRPPCSPVGEAELLESSWGGVRGRRLLPDCVL